MRTDELIERLAEQPFPRTAPTIVLARALSLGIAVSFAVMLVWLHVRPDLAQAALTSAFWLKFAYAGSFTALAFWLAVQLARPTGALRFSSLLVFLPLLVISGFALIQLVASEGSGRLTLIMGNSWNVCSWRIVVLSIPILGGMIVAFRQLAPTDLTWAGIAAGLLAGAAGTVVYALHCDESAAPFVAVWYTLGMTVVGALGGLFGRMLLRW